MAHHGRYPRIVTPTPAPWYAGLGGDDVDGDWRDDYEYDGSDRDDCERCGGDGHLEYMEAGPDVWGEDCPSEVNHLVVCPDCVGTGIAR